jgi:hypothetical protein
MKTIYPIIPILALFLGCVTVKGTYVVSAHDSAGNELARNVRLIASGGGIYSARNALCSKYPGATININDAQTGQELKSESPYRC